MKTFPQPKNDELMPDAWLKLPVCLTDDERMRVIRDCVKARGVMLSRLHRYSPYMTNRSKQRAVRRYFLCETVRVATLYQCLKSRRVEMGAGARWSYAKVIERGRRLNVFDPEHAPVRVGQIEKKNSEYRIVFAHSHEDFARHRMAYDAWRAVDTFHPRQFSCHGGEKALKEWLERELPNTALVLTTDFPNFFLSLATERLNVVAPIPRSVTQALLVTPFEELAKAQRETNLDAFRGARALAPMKDVRGACGWLPLEDWYPNRPSCVGELGDGWGVPPGSPLTQIVSQAVLREILSQVEAAAKGVECGCVGDDIIILLRDDSAKDIVISTLAAAVRDAIRDGAQKELLQRIKARTPKQGFSFVGYKISLERDEVRFSSKSPNWEAVENRLVSEFLDGTLALDEAAVVNRIASGLRRYDNDPKSSHLAILAAYRVGACIGLDEPMSRARMPCDIEIYTDGGAKSSAGPGAWAAIVYENGTKRRHSGTMPLASNNEMELLAVVEALEAIEKPASVRVISDSKYVVDSARLNLERWRKQRWRNGRDKPLANRRLWRRLDKQLSRHTYIEFEWVKGHASDRRNKEVDGLVKEVLRGAP